MMYYYDVLPQINTYMVAEKEIGHTKKDKGKSIMPAVVGCQAEDRLNSEEIKPVILRNQACNLKKSSL